MRYMHFDQKTLEEQTLMRGKITAVIPTSTAAMDFFRMAVLSLLLRSNPSHLEHVIVTINGPDERTGDPSLQDEKERWLRQMLREKWCGRDMPLTIQRTLSRVGHAQALESAAAWVHTEHYLAMHDDVIVLDRDWSSTVLSSFADPRVAVQCSPPTVLGSLSTSDYFDGRQALNFPHLSTFFTAVRKSALVDVGARWPGYHVEGSFCLADSVIDQLVASHRPDAGPVRRVTHDVWSQDIGVWVKARLENSGYTVSQLPASLCHHFVAASWHDPAAVEQRRQSEQQRIDALRSEVLRSGFARYWDAA